MGGLRLDQTPVDLDTMSSKSNAWKFDAKSNFKCGAREMVADLESEEGLTGLYEKLARYPIGCICDAATGATQPQVL